MENGESSRSCEPDIGEATGDSFGEGLRVVHGSLRHFARLGTSDSQCFRGADRGGETQGTGLAAIFNSPLAATGTGIVDRGPFSIPTHWRIDGPRWMGGRGEWEECIGKAEGGVGVPFCLKRPRALPRS